MCTCINKDLSERVSLLSLSIAITKEKDPKIFESSFVIVKFHGSHFYIADTLLRVPSEASPCSCSYGLSLGSFFFRIDNCVFTHHQFRYYFTMKSISATIALLFLLSAAIQAEPKEEQMEPRKLRDSRRGGHRRGKGEKTIDPRFHGLNAIML